MQKVTRDLVRETSYVDPKSGNPIVIQLNEGGKTVTVRVKRTHTEFRVTVEQIWNLALRTAMHAAQAEREGR